MAPRLTGKKKRNEADSLTVGVPGSSASLTQVKPGRINELGMAETRERLQPSPGIQPVAAYIAMVVRNAMEDFHCAHLSDAQMKELNPIVRDGICTALHALENRRRSKTAEAFVRMTLRMIPGYWEEAQLMDDYLELDEYMTKKPRRKARDRSSRGGRRAFPSLRTI